MLFKVKEVDVLTLVEDFLLSQNLLSSVRELEKESKVVIGQLNEVRLDIRSPCYTWQSKSITLKVNT